jgi:RHS repeat-associated protein
VLFRSRLFAAAGISGLAGPYYNWNRWYLPSVGRYLELDPIAKAGGFNGFYGPNWYGYAEGNPSRLLDPTGLSWSSNAGFLWEWLWGGGQTNRSYCDGDFQQSELKNSFGVAEFRERFYEGGCSSVRTFCFGTFDALIWTLDDPSSTAFQVGGFCGSATRNGDSVTYRVRNEAGTQSFFYHLLPNRSGSCGPMRTIKQTFEWTEPLNHCACGKCLCE